MEWRVACPGELGAERAVVREYPATEVALPHRVASVAFARVPVPYPLPTVEAWRDRVCSAEGGFHLVAFVGDGHAPPPPRTMMALMSAPFTADLYSSVLYSSERPFGPHRPVAAASLHMLNGWLHIWMAMTLPSQRGRGHMCRWCVDQ